jgi:acetyltransferase-like isoleucine patch superfamily enzyme
METFYKLPLEDVNEDSAIISKIFFNSGDSVSEDEPLFSFETTKTAQDIFSKSAGYIYYLIKEGETYKVGTEICLITDDKDFDLQTFFDKRHSEYGLQVANLAFKITKKAEVLANALNIDLSEHKLSGVVREKDIYKILESTKSNSLNKRGDVKFLDVSNKFTHDLLYDKSLRALSSKEKIELYKQNGHYIGKNVTLGNGSIIIANTIHIEDNVSIGENTFIEIPEVKIGKNTKIGIEGSFVASSLIIDHDVYIGDRVSVDISGGRHFDSNLKVGYGSLISNESYINACREVILGSQAALSPRSMIFTHSYWQSVLDGYTSNFGPVEMKDNSWLGAAAQILPNIIVGEGSIIMSNSVVGSNVSEYSLVGGIPAQKIRENINHQMNQNQKINELEKLIDEFSIFIQELGYKVSSIDGSSISIEDNGKKRILSILPHGQNEALENLDIVICFPKDEFLDKAANSVFCIEESSFRGTFSKIESVIHAFLRRKGIRFYI